MMQKIQKKRRNVPPTIDITIAVVCEEVNDE